MLLEGRGLSEELKAPRESNTVLAEKGGATGFGRGCCWRREQASLQILLRSWRLAGRTA